MLLSSADVCFRSRRPGPRTKFVSSWICLSGALSQLRKGGQHILVQPDQRHRHVHAVKPVQPAQGGIRLHIFPQRFQVASCRPGRQAVGAVNLPHHVRQRLRQFRPLRAVLPVLHPQLCLNDSFLRQLRQNSVVPPDRRRLGAVSRQCRQRHGNPGNRLPIHKCRRPAARRSHLSVRQPSRRSSPHIQLFRRFRTPRSLHSASSSASNFFHSL